jgi:hypothetical protein
MYASMVVEDPNLWSTLSGRALAFPDGVFGKLGVDTALFKGNSMSCVLTSVCLTSGVFPRLAGNGDCGGGDGVPALFIAGCQRSKTLALLAFLSRVSLAA